MGETHYVFRHIGKGLMSNLKTLQLPDRSE